MSMNKYLEAKSYNLSIGMRFKMRFVCDEISERRYLLLFALPFCYFTLESCLLFFLFCLYNLTVTVAQLSVSMILDHQDGQILNGDL